MAGSRDVPVLETLGGFVMAAAAGLVARLLGDAIQGRRRRFDRREIEQRACEEAVRHAPSPVHAPAVTVHVVAEAKRLSRQIPGVRVDSGAIEIDRIGPPIAITPAARRRRRQDLESRLLLLDELVDKRNRELGLGAAAASFPRGQKARPLSEASQARSTPIGGASSITGRLGASEESALVLDRPTKRLIDKGVTPSTKSREHRIEALKSRLSSLDNDIARREAELLRHGEDGSHEPS